MIAAQHMRKVCPPTRALNGRRCPTRCRMVGRASGGSRIDPRFTDGVTSRIAALALGWRGSVARTLQLWHEPEKMNNHRTNLLRLVASSSLVRRRASVTLTTTRKTNNMEIKDFGWAIRLLKNGKRVARAGWNGKGMYLWLLPAATVKAEWCREPHLKAMAEANGGEIEALGSIRMMTADKKVLTGWLASQTDILAEDWETLD